MSTSRPIPGFGTFALDYGEEAPDPPPHHHVGPWAVYQAYDPRRYSVDDRTRAALVLRYLARDPSMPRAELVALGRRALATVLVARLLGQVPDDLELYLRIIRDDPTRQGSSTAPGYA